MKNRLLRSYLQYDWWKIVGIFLVGSISLYSIFQSKDRLKDNEILDVFITGEVLDYSYQEKMFSSVENNIIHAVNSTNYSQDDVQYYQLASSYLSSVSDLYLLPESVISSHKEYVSYSLPLDIDTQNKIKAIDPSYSFYIDSNDKARGIKVFDKEDKEFNENKNISSYFFFKETTYLFISNNSTNNKDVDKNGNHLLLEFALSFLKISLK
ncbi:MAG: hypothetical protein SO132_02565 [Candidatus Enteromonas sp.]|nr:hypothetical protein [Mollicutes bacterium]MDD7715652.1 hypothetical protein [Mollicutes bacterium]MDY3903928.1 hypothetical protein [Candidatus Enteromonas sp.]MDY4935638.1 hypothetical protein [Candidatus Enteromonas sp.]